MKEKTGMAQQTLTHRDLSEALGVSVTTVKSYRRKFPGFIPVAGYGKPIRFRPRALDVCKKIRECFEQGLSVLETEKRLRKAGFRPEGSDADSPVGGAPREIVQSAATHGVVSPEYLEQFFKTAGQMMQGMAQLATAQAKSEKRLSRLEEALQGLLEAEAGSQALLGELAAGFRSDRSVAETGFEEQSSPGAEPATTSQERRVRAKKIVNVRGRAGVESYSLEDGAKDDPQAQDGVQARVDEAPQAEKDSDTKLLRPPQEFLDMPVAIRSDQGDFLGLPGRLSLGDFTTFLVRMESEAGPVHSSWDGVDKTWTLNLRTQGENRRELGFAKHTTRRGVELAVLLHLNTNGAVANQEELMEFFRETKDLIHHFS
jgi:DNA-binding transcriptional MerR regulator